MKRRAARWAALLVAGWAALGPTPGSMSGAALAQAPPDPGGAPLTPELERAERARELNRSGVLMMKADDPQRALAYFEDSRAMLATAKNTTNYALCLHRLGRFDEALLAFEEVYLRFADDLDAEDRATIPEAMAELRSKVGSLLVTAGAGAEVFVDGRSRGLLPFKVPLRLNAGAHTLRVIRDGFSPHESTVTIRAEATGVVDVRLDPLVGRGQIQVQIAGKPADVFVDGARVGTSPWEGTLTTGPHVIWAKRGEFDGSAPTTATILEAQTVLIRPVVSSLGPNVRVSVDPPTARLELNGELMPGGRWDGRLPPGTYSVAGTETGYFVARRQIVVPEAGEPIDIVLQLPFDEAHPRWPRGASGELWVGAIAGYAGSPSLGAQAEERCPEACADDDPWVHGFVAGARGGYRWPMGLSFEVDAAFLWAGTSFTRTLTDDFAASTDGEVTFSLEDAPRVRGPIVTAGASYVHELQDWVSFEGRLTAGLLVAFADDVITGTASTPRGGKTDVLLADRNETLVGPALTVWPSVGARFDLGRIELGAGLGALIVPTSGASYAHEAFGARPARDRDNPGAVGNAPLSNAIADERSFGPFVLLVPEIGLFTTL